LKPDIRDVATQLEMNEMQLPVLEKELEVKIFAHPPPIADRGTIRHYPSL